MHALRIFVEKVMDVGQGVLLWLFRGLHVKEKDSVTFFFYIIF